MEKVKMRNNKVDGALQTKQKHLAFFWVLLELLSLKFLLPVL